MTIVKEYTSRYITPHQGSRIQHHEIVNDNPDNLSVHLRSDINDFSHPRFYRLYSSYTHFSKLALKSSLKSDLKLDLEFFFGPCIDIFCRLITPRLAIARKNQDIEAMQGGLVYTTVQKSFRGRACGLR